MVNWLVRFLRGGRGRARVWKSGRDHYSVVVSRGERYEVDVYESRQGDCISFEIGLSNAADLNGLKPMGADAEEMKHLLAASLSGKNRSIYFV